MQQLSRKIFFITLLSSLGMITAADNDLLTSSKTFGHTFFSPRSQGSNLARRLVGVTEFFVPCDIDCLNGFLAFTPHFTRSFDRDEIGKFLFYNGTNMMTFGTAGTADVFARNFFLNDNFNGVLTALPRVENAMLDVQFRLNLDEWVCGLYFDLHAPITWTQWSVNFDQNITSVGTEIGAGALGNINAAPSPVGSILAAYNGQQLNTTVFPALKQVLQFGRVDTSDAENGSSEVSGKQTRTRLADVETALGYNFLCDECYHVGADFRVIFPAGNRPAAVFLFEPIAGNGKHYEVGAGISTHYEFWNNCCDSSFSMWAEANFYTVLKGRQRRLFDLKNADGTQNVGSSHLLIKKFVGGIFQEVIFGPNVLALNCKVRNSLHLEAAILFDYYRCGFILDAGYNLWMRTQDKISNIQALQPQTFGLAGLTTALIGNALSDVTGSTAKINGTGGLADPTIVYLTNDQLFVGSAANPEAVSHKFFAHVSYAWEDCDYTPFLGLGGEVEFSGKGNFALDQWGIWIKGGFAFS